MTREMEVEMQLHCSQGAALHLHRQQLGTAQSRHQIALCCARYGVRQRLRRAKVKGGRTVGREVIMQGSCWRRGWKWTQTHCKHISTVKP